MTSVKARKRYLRPEAPGGREFVHGASFAHRGETIPRQVFSYRRVLLRLMMGARSNGPGS